jgi:predicted ATPase
MPKTSLRSKVLELGEKVITGFNVDENIAPVFDKLCLYFGAKNNGYRKKGIMLIGKVGTGKTSLFRIFDQFTRYWHRENMFVLYQAKEIERIYAKEGQAGFDKVLYNSCPWFGDPNFQKIYNICVDDIGTEAKAKNYSSVIEPVEELILSRYELFITKGTITHFTTNLGVNELKKRYSNRAISRLNEMCQVLYLKGTDRRF